MRQIKKGNNMMNEEQLIRSHLDPHKNPFRVPEGYFDNFASELMKKLPEEKPAAKRISLRPWMYAAACAFVAILTTAVFFSAPDSTESQQPVAVTSSVAAANDSFDEAADYAMLDNQDIYACLMGE